MHDASDNSNSTLPSNLEACHALIEKQSAELEQVTSEKEKLRKLLSHLVNGNQSERRILSGPSQQLLPFESEQEYEAAKQEAETEAKQIIEKYEVNRHQRKKKRRNESLPADLPRVEVAVDVDDSLKACLKCGERQQIGEDVQETLVIEPPKAYVEVRRFPKFACPADKKCGITSPERPTGLVEGNRYSPSVAASIVDYKWGHYLPIYRQQDLFAACGWTPRRSTLCNLVEATEFAVDPLLDLMKRRVQQDIGVGIDDTSCRMLLPKVDPPVDPKDPKSLRLAEKLREARSKGHKSLLAKMWVYSGLWRAPYHIFDFRVSRHRDGPDDFFKDSRCYVQGDCFSGNTSVVVHSDGRLEFVACWAHARRKVAEAKTYEKEAEQLLSMLQTLYDIETRAKEYSPEQRKQLRTRESTTILNTLRKWLDSPVVAEVLPKSDFGESLRYIRNHWQALNVYLGDGRLPIDNNLVEQLMKQVALGRKAWLFVSNVAGGERSAKMMSLVSSARRHDLDSRLYIQDILTQLLVGSTEYESMLPDRWKQSHPEAIRRYPQEELRDKADRKQLKAARRRQKPPSLNSHTSLVLLDAYFDSKNQPTVKQPRSAMPENTRSRLIRLFPQY
ncbi:MAG: IS66 family transposase [Planctomycetota bacterium]